jgi:thioredoxin-related protein
MPYGLLCSAAVSLIITIAVGFYESKHPPQLPDLVHWSQLAVVDESSAAEPILYDFSSKHCDPCDQMQQEVFGDEDLVRQISRAFIPVRVEEDDQSPSATELRQRFSVTAYPTLVVSGHGLKEPMFLHGYEGKEATARFFRRAISKSFEFKLNF